MLQMYISVMKSHVNMCHSQFRGSLSLQLAAVFSSNAPHASCTQIGTTRHDS